MKHEPHKFAGTGEFCTECDAPRNHKAHTDSFYGQIRAVNERLARERVEPKTVAQALQEAQPGDTIYVAPNGTVIDNPGIPVAGEHGPVKFPAEPGGMEKAQIYTAKPSPPYASLGPWFIDGNQVVAGEITPTPIAPSAPAGPEPEPRKVTMSEVREAIIKRLNEPEAPSGLLLAPNDPTKKAYERLGYSLDKVFTGSSRRIADKLKAIGVDIGCDTRHPQTREHVPECETEVWRVWETLGVLPSIPGKPEPEPFGLLLAPNDPAREAYERLGYSLDDGPHLYAVTPDGAMVRDGKLMTVEEASKTYPWRTSDTSALGGVWLAVRKPDGWYCTLEQGLSDGDTWWLHAIRESDATHRKQPVSFSPDLLSNNPTIVTRLLQARLDRLVSVPMTSLFASVCLLKSSAWTGDHGSIDITEPRDLRKFLRISAGLTPGEVFVITYERRDRDADNWRHCQFTVTGLEGPNNAWILSPGRYQQVMVTRGKPMVKWEPSRIDDLIGTPIEATSEIEPHGSHGGWSGDGKGGKLTRWTEPGPPTHTPGGRPYSEIERRCYNADTNPAQAYELGRHDGAMDGCAAEREEIAAMLEAKADQEERDDRYGNMRDIGRIEAFREAARMVRERR